MKPRRTEFDDEDREIRHIEEDASDLDEFFGSDAEDRSRK